MIEPSNRMRWTTRAPCASCPYRRDAKLEFWHPDHFIKLLADESDLIGHVYGCHGTAKLAEGPSVCAGWLIDQRRRGLPSNALRIALCINTEAKTALDEVSDGGHELYGSVREMCAANGVE